MREWAQDDLERVCRAWQQVLCLQRWSVDIAFERGYDFAEDAGAHIHFNRKSLGATIHILHPGDWVPTWGKKQDIEEDIVHELLHLLIAPLTESDYEATVDEEQVIVVLSRALAGMKRFFEDE